MTPVRSRDYLSTPWMVELTPGVDIDHFENHWARAMVSKYFLPAYSRMLHLKKKEEYVMAIWPTLQTNRRKKTDNAHHPIDTVLKSGKS